MTRLKTVLDKQNGSASELPKARAALTIQADASTNIIIVAARADVMPLIADVINSMDVPGAGSLNTVRFYPLENADATRIQTVVNSLYTGPNAKMVRDEDKPTIAVDTHCFRVANRTGLAPGATPEAVEAGLLAVVPERWLMHAHHWLILHGRYVCTARKPTCSACPVSDLCDFTEKN